MTTARPVDTLASSTAASLQMEADLRLVAAQRLRAALVTEQIHQLDPADAAFAAMACNCPKACSCDADYPGFAEWVAAREADNQRAREAK